MLGEPKPCVLCGVLTRLRWQSTPASDVAAEQLRREGRVWVVELALCCECNPNDKFLVRMMNVVTRSLSVATFPSIEAAETAIRRAAE